MSMRVGLGNYGEVMSPSDFAIVARTHKIVPYSFSEWMVVHFELVRLEKMGMTLENLVEMMSPTFFEFIAIFTTDFQTLFSLRFFFNWMF